jgi:formamidopyrimidine-DNA glycosylase
MGTVVRTTLPVVDAIIERQAELGISNRQVALRIGISRQGATLSNYATPDGERGAMQDEFSVYGRAGEPCARCGTPIEKIRAAGRGTWYCPHCQSLG